MAKKKESAGATPATAELVRAGVGFTLHEYHHDPASTHFGDEAAHALGVDARRIFKTLVVALVGAPHPLACAVVPVAAQLDLKHFAQVAGAKKASLAEQVDAERSTGYLVGGISPLGQKRHLPTWIDESATTLETLYVSAGRRGLQVELAPEDLAATSGAAFAAIARTD